MSEKVYCGGCKWLRTDGPLDQWYHYCGLDEAASGYERLLRWHERAGNRGMSDELDGTCERAEPKSPTLCELLDELGVEWWDDSESVYWDGIDGTSWTAERRRAGDLYLCSIGCTPEQAIAATLGRGTCHDTGECLAFRCSECGFGVEDIFINDERVYFDAFPMYCPHCGRRVVKADA